MDILILIGVFIVAFSWGWSVREQVAEHKTKKLMEKIEKQLHEEEVENIMKIKIEKHNDMLFVYDYHTDMFIVQAKDRPELEEKLEKLYPGKKFGATPANLKEVGFSS